MVSAILSRLVILVFGTLYPAYASYKAVRTKNVKEYVKWMMYWIVFALFCTVETFSDFFLSWFPFYYEFKIVFVLWMLSPITQGSSFLFKKFVHPQLARREKDIDEMIEQATKQGYSAFVDLGNKGFKVILNSVIMGQTKLVDHLRRSYSTSDLSNDGHDIVQRHDALGDQDEYREDELDNRLIEDQAELAKYSASVAQSRGSSSALSLTSVKEEDGEDSEHVITETFTIAPSTRRHHSVREDKSASPQLRCQSLPPFADRYTKPLIIASTNLESKRQYFSKFQSVEKKEITSNRHSQASSSLESKRRLLTRSLSQDSGTAKMLSTISSFASSSGRKARGSGSTKASSECEEIINADEHTLKSDSTASKQPASDNQLECSLSKKVSVQQQTEPEIKQESLGKETEVFADEGLTRRSVPRFQNDLPVIDETVPLEIAPQTVITDRPEVSIQPDTTEDSNLLQIYEDNTGEPKFNLLSVENRGDDLSGLIFLNVEDDLDDQCPTPVAKDSPPNLSQGDEKENSAKGKYVESELNVEEDLVSKESDTSSVSDFGSFDQTDTEVYSERSDSSIWETMSEASTTDSAEGHIEDMQASVIRDEVGPWSAPGSPASFIRGSKYEEDEIQSWNTPSSLLSRRMDEASWAKSRVQRQTSLPSTASRSVLYSWPSPSHFSASASSSQIKDKLSAKSYRHNFDPFQTWHPPSSSGATSYRSHSVGSSSTAYLPRTLSSVSGRSGRPVDQSASLSLAGGEAMYGRYQERAYRISPLSPRPHSRPRLSSLSSGRFSSSMPSNYSFKTYSSYTSKK